MAIAFDTSSSLGSQGSSPQSWSHTCTGSSLILWVNAYQGPTEVVTGVTYNSVAMTKVAYTNNLTAGADRGCSLWYLVNPATGTNTITVTASSGNISGTGSSFTGASQTGVPDSFNTAKSTVVGNLAVNTTVVAANCWLVIGGTDTGNGVGLSGGTLRQSVGGGGQGFIGDSNATVGTGSQGMTATDGTPNFFGLILASFAPAGAAATVLPYRALLGVGI